MSKVRARFMSFRTVPAESLASPQPSPPAWIPVALAALVLLVRVIVFPLNENLYGDAVARTELALVWARAPHWISSYLDGARQFGPLHLYLVGAASWLFPPEHAGRVVSLVFGVASAFPLYALTRRLFDLRAAVWACLAFAAWGMHVQMSTTASSEALFVFLVLVAFWKLQVALEENRVAPLALSAVCLNLAMATRYEAWMLTAVLTVLIVFHDPDRLAGVTRAVFFAVLCAPFPLLWLHGNQLAGDALIAVKDIDAYHRAYAARELAALGPWQFRLTALGFWPGTALLTLSPLVALFGVAGLWRTLRDRRDLRWLGWALLIPVLYFTFRGAVLTTFAPMTRFTAAQLVFLLPFVASGFDAVVSRRARRWLLGVTAATAVLLPAAMGLFTFRREGKLEDWVRPVSPTSTNPRAVLATAEVVSRLEGVVLLDAAPRYEDLQVAFFSGLPDERLVRARWDDFTQRLWAAPSWVLLMGGALEQRSDFRAAGDRVELLGARFLCRRASATAPFRLCARAQ